MEWLEVGDDEVVEGDEPTVAAPSARPIRWPSEEPTPVGAGPIVPNTPGLRVPDAGYWTRVRLDVADVLMPFTWLSELHGEGRVILRLNAARRGEVRGGAPSAQRLTAVVPIVFPPGTDAEQLGGLVLGADALADATVSFQSTRKDRWLVTLERLALEETTRHMVKGTLEGTARRGAHGRKSRRFEAGFIALRAPSGTPAAAVAAPTP